MIGITWCSIITNSTVSKWEQEDSNHSHLCWCCSSTHHATRRHDDKSTKPYNPAHTHRLREFSISVDEFWFLRVWVNTAELHVIVDESLWLDTQRTGCGRLTRMGVARIYVHATNIRCKLKMTTFQQVITYCMLHSYFLSQSSFICKVAMSTVWQRAGRQL